MSQVLCSTIVSEFLDDEKCTLTLCVESNPGSLEGRVILLDRNCTSMWNVGYIYFFCTPLIMTVSLILIVLLRV
jgi:hypothetical protein